MKKITFLCLLLGHFICQSQTTYNPGYFITNDGSKTTCKIQNKTWQSNPTKFKYKLPDNPQELEADISMVKEFAFENAQKYIRQTVKLDRSSEEIYFLDKQRTANFIQEQLFLEVIIEGKASLYRYKDKNLKRFFMSLDTIKFEPLVYKKYITRYGEIGTNNYFRQQLRHLLSCEQIKQHIFERLAYKTAPLKSLFEKYNACQGDPFIAIKQGSYRDWFNLRFRAGLVLSNITIDNSRYDYRDVTFKNEPGFLVGVESEFILPHTKEKLSFVAEPSYQQFTAEKANDYNTHIRIKYMSLRLPLSLRYSINVHKNSNLFINAGWMLESNLNSLIIYDEGTNLAIKNRSNTFMGMGIGYKHKISLECRYCFPRNLTRDFATMQTDYDSWAFILGYSIF